jgi:hypothetical protein
MTLTSLLAAVSEEDQATSHSSDSVVVGNVNYTTMRRPCLESGPAKSMAAPALRWLPEVETSSSNDDSPASRQSSSQRQNLRGS